MSNTPNTDRINQIVKLRPSLASLKNEAILNLDLMPISVAQAEVDKKNFKINNNDIENLIFKIPFRAFDKLLKEATGNNPVAKKYITCLYIYLGVDMGISPDKITPLFKTAYLKRIETLGVNTSFQIKNNNIFHVFNIESKKFDVYKGTEKLMDDYINAIFIQGNRFRKGIDTEAVIIPFQELYALEHDNPNATEAWLYNCIQNSTTLTQGLNKHSILFSPERNIPFEGGFELKIANRTHLCPPFCDSTKNIPYQIE